MNNLLQFLRRNKESTASTAPDSFSKLKAMMQDLIRARHSKCPMRVTNTRQVILNRIWLLFEALSLEVLRDGWTVQNHRLLNHIKSVFWQLPDEAEVEGLEDALNGMLTYQL